MKTKISLFLLFSFSILGVSNSQVSSNFRVYPDTNLQVETPLCVSPQNSNIFAGASITDYRPGGKSLGFYITTNSGLNWTGTSNVNLQDTTIEPGGNPSIAINSSGKIALSYLFTKKNENPIKYYVGISLSTNNGTNWSSTIRIPKVAYADKDFITIDNSATSSKYGNMYVVYAEVVGITTSIYFSKSVNAGVTWDSAKKISSGSGSLPSVTVGKNGEIYVCCSGGVGIGFLKSTDAGDSWTEYPGGIYVNAPSGYQYFTDSVLFTGTPYIACDKNNHNIYITCWATTSTDTYDILVLTSTNQGTNWTSARANSDNTGYGKYQFFPYINVDDYGGVNVLYYDTRHTIGNDSCQIYLSRSIDSGKTFNNYLISDHKFYLKKVLHTGHPSLFSFNEFIGTYIGLASNTDKLLGLWYDNSNNNNYQAWNASFTFGPHIIHTPLTNTTQLSGYDTVKCTIIPVRSATNASKTKVYWSRNNTSVTDSIVMTNSSGNKWYAAIPINGTPSVYRYYIKSYDNLNNVGVSPDRAPTNLYKFVTSGDLTPPIITHTPITDQPQENFPCLVSANVADADGAGIGKVWVAWSKNSGLRDTFQLNLQSSDLYSALFNQPNNYVTYGDMIHYKIFAKDNTLAENTDSTDLYDFKIDYFYLCEDFNSGTFPPVNWSVIYSGTNFWSSSSVGYSDTNSGRYHTFAIASRTIQYLEAATFTSSVTNDKLGFYYAHASKLSGTDADSLVIQASTNNGTSYTNLAILTGNDLKSAANTNSDFVPASTSDWKFITYNLSNGTNKIRFKGIAGGGNNIYLDKVCVSEYATPTTASVIVIPEGFYNSSTGKLNSRDTVRVYFRNYTAPYHRVDSIKAVIDSVNFTATGTFQNTHSGSYYLEINHRNSIKVWSKHPVNYVKGSAFSYNFTTSDTTAYGDNLTQVSSKYCLYSGDVNQLGEVNTTDLLLIYADIVVYATGYVPTDITGDKITDLTDLIVCQNNSNSFVQAITP